VNAARSPLRCSGLRPSSLSLLDDPTRAELRRGCNGIKWTTEQLLVQMLLGYLVVGNLDILMRIFGRFVDGFPRAFAPRLERWHRPLPRNHLPGRPREST